MSSDRRQPHEHELEARPGEAVTTHTTQRHAAQEPARLRYERIIRDDIRERFEGMDACSQAATAALVAQLRIRQAGAAQTAYSVELAGACPRPWLAMFERTLRRLLKIGWNRELSMVRQKGGRALMYIRGGTRPMHTILDRFEARSAKTCAVCGAGAERQTPGLCGPHGLTGWPSMACLIAPESWGKRRRCWKGPGA